MRRIVVGADFSPSSEIAGEHAIHLGRIFGAELVFTHVGEPDSPGEGDGIRIELARLRERATTLDVRSSSRIIGGHPDEALAELAADLEADMICVGTHGRTGFERFVIGSVAEKTSRVSRCDVLVARGRDPWNGYRRVLVPTDFSAAADRALDLALLLTSRQGNVHLLHCWKSPAPLVKTAETALAEKAERVGEEATRRAATLVENHPGGDVDLTFEIRHGPADKCIREALGAGEWDLVVLGSHGRRGVRRFLLGSVAEKTIRHAPCSVLVTHPNHSDLEGED